MPSTRSAEDPVGGVEELVQGAGLALDREARTRLAAYVALLFRWNERMNLTALDAGEEGLQRLVVEPLVAGRQIPPEARTMIDIGSGNGSPAIPVKIARPELLVRMVESRARKAAFLREAVRRLKLAETVVENCRFEALVDNPQMREAHDVLTVRGVRVDGCASERLQELVRPGGTLLVFAAGGGSEAEVALQAAGGVVETRAALESSGSELIVIRKR